MAHAPSQCPDENELVAFSEGSLGPTQRASLEQHISTCELCAELVADAARAPASLSHDQPTMVDGAAQSPADSMLTTGFRRGDRIGRYVILEPLGQGAMGFVFTAYDPQLERAVALKVLRPELDDDGPARPNSRLRREAQAAAKLRHPNVVTIYESDKAGELSYIAMELIEGDNLRRWLSAQARDWREVLAVFLQAGQGLAAAHRAKILHRDFKPDNVLVDQQGRVKVVDFGLATAGDAAPLSQSAEVELEGSLAGTVLTQTGMVLGTPVYMAPEQHHGHPLDGRADQYAWCVALWEGLHGIRPFSAANIRDLGVAKRRMQLSPTRRNVPRWLHAALVRGLSPDPADRFETMDELLLTLVRRPRTRRVAVIGVVAASCVGAISTAAFLSGRAQTAPAAAACDMDPIQRVWNEPRAAALREAFDETGLPYAAASADAVVGELDDWSNRWRDARLGVCDAHDENDPSSAERFELRVRCLDRSTDAADALLGELETVDAAVVEKAPRMSSALSPPDDCLRSSAELRRALALSDDPQRQRELDEVDAMLLESWALAEAGRYAKARDVAKPALQHALELEDSGLEARGLYEMGNVSDRLGEFDEAGTYFDRAVLTAEAAGLDRIAAKALTAQIYIVGATKMDIKAADLLAGLTRAKIERLGGDPKLLGQLENNLAIVDFGAGDVESALQHQRLSLSHGLVAYDADSLQLAASRDNLAAILLAAGETGEAVEMGRESLAAAIAVVGPNHPQLAQMNGNLSSALYLEGDYKKALEHADESIRLLEQLDAPTAFLAHAYNNRGNVLSQLGRDEDARDALVKALDVHERLHGPEHPNVAMALDNLGSVERSLGQPESAKSRHTRAASIRLAVAEPDDARLFYSYRGLGLAELELGDFEAARTNLEVALEAYERGINDPVAQADARFGLARTLDALGDSKQATVVAKQARDALGTEWQDETIAGELDDWLAAR